MTDFVQILAIAIMSMMSYLLGATTPTKRASSVRLVDKWPDAHIQFDSDMSQEDVLRFLDMTREMVLTGDLAKPKKAKDQCTSNKGEQPLGGGDD